ncbi:glycine betaine/L-proline ABC transporter ATP-binding protein [Tetragenococcus koreensis]|uniref:Quaternary amine transport ATP-binding protein n=1 Tax=Tetragenococcus koreensis TaxID=290335 RepID=A0AAN4UBV5_9ENTE|nr:glycine betaine/L-proline ABC transporter ATP-binding protein [Tetragenococcus koreensis]AYW46866.1 glycine betaine/L-proline ABC transporter ATP-binding protein [Tetragenococcus koreensis]MCF1585077.1 glycine betaine/L-proline ABC transporter ATP-binding protein [Tetragenococcus koreensis]MCF1620830.1 glycine betaine/L-proline ABC transporter ATP-binding protein [Tetragenococcus koreensis]MCF1629395.1 glycine betaine/L-proline ABC transporter ATP-binding protein [Tetragenococcus koreensis]
MSKVRVEHLTKVFGRRTQQALDLVKEGKSKQEILKETGATVGVHDVSFDVEEGEVFVIMGLSGSGKSTLVRLINRLIEPTSGEVYIDDEDVAKMSKEDLREVRRTKVNMVFQNFGLLPQRTVLENTEYGLEVRGVAKEERQKKAEEALDNSGLLSVKDQFPSQLSGGMQQRVGLARALANDPEILLMDEAFSALDPLIRRDMQDDLLDLQERVQKTIIFITHDLDEALRIGDRIALMRDGKIMQIGTGEEILTHPANDFVREFTEDIDRSKVLTAENIMEPALVINAEEDGPNVALQRMRKEEVSMLLAVDRKRHLDGSLTAEEALDARKNDKPLKEVIDKNVRKIQKDTLVTDIFDLIYNSPAPLAVVDENDRVAGVVVRGSVIGAMTASDKEEENEETNNNEKTASSQEEADENGVNVDA